MIREAKYVFKYDKGPVPIEEKVHAFADPVEGRRWWEQEYESRYYPYVPQPRHPLNYKGSGVTDTQVIEAEIVYEERMNTRFDTDTSVFILYYLPDVDAFAKASYFHGSEDGPEYPSTTSMTVTLLDKTV
ncbi:hypothetical protein 015DV004_203 [Bacillus phage 015DV004]|nr:hypothetical protein 015DV004_203 [Bacillus phage 015DV004]